MDKRNIQPDTTQYLFFILDDEKYAVEAKYVQEIVDFINITSVPKSNPCVKGVTNIRGELIPVVDPKKRFGIGQIEIKKRTSFIILQILNKTKNKNTSIAVMVDIVIEVEDIDVSNTLQTPQFGTKIDQKYISGIIRYDNEYISILDIDQVLNIQELAKS